jgi:hypothetical protein
MASVHARKAKTSARKGLARLCVPWLVVTGSSTSKSLESSGIMSEMKTKSGFVKSFGCLREHYHILIKRNLTHRLQKKQAGG